MTEVMNPPLPGKVPEHWKALRLKHWIGINESVLPESTDPGFEFRYMEISAVDHGRLIEFPQKTHFEVAPSRARRRVKLGDTLLSTVRTYLKAIWYAENPGDDLVCSTGFAVLTPKKGTNPKYVNYLVQSEPFTDRITAESVGTAYPAISENKLASFEVRVPPTDEQAAIVRYLDDADQRIQEYVSAKERLIALLEEERQAVIHQAITRGLDPNAKLKHSGVEWLGDVPEDWDVMPLKRVGAFKSGAGFPISEQGSQGSELPFFKVSDMNIPGNERILKKWNNSVSPETAKGLGASTLPAGSILFPKVGGALLTNKRRITERCCCIDNNLMGCTVDEGNPDFVLLLLEQIDLGNIAKPGPVPAISEGEVREIRAAFPSLEEQGTIVQRLAHATVPIDTTMERARRQIDLMEEYRTRLIADVATGKIDVSRS